MSDQTSQEIHTRDIRVARNGRVTITQEIGLSQGQFEEVLRNRERDFVNILGEREQISVEERARLKVELEQTKAALMNSKAAYEKQFAELEITLASMGADKVIAAQAAIGRNETALAELYFKQALEQFAITHALAAHHAACIARDRYDTQTGLRYARLAVYLQPTDELFRSTLGDLALRAGFLDEAEVNFTAAAQSPMNGRLLEEGFVLPPDYRKLRLAEFLLEWRENPAMASEIVGPYAAYIDRIGFAPFANQVRQLCLRLNIAMPQDPGGILPLVAGKPEETIATLSRDGTELGNSGRLQEARDAFERALAMANAQSPTDPLLVGMSQINLAGILVRINEYEEAESLWNSAKSTLGENHEFILNSLFNFAERAGKSGNNEISERWYKQALYLAVQHQGKNSNSAINIRQALAQLAADHGDFKRALALLNEIKTAADNRMIERWTPSDFEALTRGIRSLEEKASGVARQDSNVIPAETHRRSWLSRLLQRLKLKASA